MYGGRLPTHLPPVLAQLRHWESVVQGTPTLEHVVTNFRSCLIEGKSLNVYTNTIMNYRIVQNKSIVLLLVYEKASEILTWAFHKPATPRVSKVTRPSVDTVKLGG